MYETIFKKLFGALPSRDYSECSNYFVGDHKQVT